MTVCHGGRPVAVAVTLRRVHVQTAGEIVARVTAEHGCVFVVRHTDVILQVDVHVIKVRKSALDTYREKSCGSPIYCRK